MERRRVKGMPDRPFRRWRGILALAVTLAALAAAACSTTEVASETTDLRQLNPDGPKDMDIEPDYFERFLSRDSIRPIYRPVALSVSEAGLSSEDQVIGVSIGGQSRAYLISTLRIREMVDDELGGTPILVTW
jgi:hypothetical protein